MKKQEETKQAQEDREDYRMIVGILSAEQGKPSPEALIEQGYRLMWTEGIRESIGSITGKAAMETSTDAIESGGVKKVMNMQEDKPPQFLALTYPLRELSGLMNDGKSIVYGFTLKTSEYRSDGGFPLIRASDAIGSGIHAGIKNAIIGNSEQDDETNLWTLYRAQEAFLAYEKQFDKIMKRIIKVKINNKWPSTLDDFKKVFAETFRETVDELGGIQKFIDVREVFYKAHEEYAKTGEHNFPAVSTIAHFKRLNAKKIALYRSTP